MSEKILTVKEFIKDYVDFNEVPFKEYSQKEIENDYELAMIEFAKMHVKEALKIALDETPYGSSTDTVSYEDCVHILDCYPPENIK